MEPFWRPDSGKNPELTDAAVADAENQLGVRLPEALLALLRIQNGGPTRGFVFPTSRPTSWATDHIALDILFGIVPADRSTGPSILDPADMTAEWSLPPKQVLLAGDGPWWITLDYRRGAVPSVTWIDVDVGEDLVLAPTFDAFLAGLLPRDVVDEESGTLRLRR